MKGIDSIKIKEIAKKLRMDAVSSEIANDFNFKQMFKDKRRSQVKVAQKIIADKQYWSGYLDALRNLSTECLLENKDMRYISKK